MKKKFQNMLILVFEVIVQVQPPKHTFEIGNFFHVLAHCVHTPGWWSDQPQNNCPERNIVGRGTRSPKKCFFYLVDNSFQKMPHSISQLIV